MDTSTIKRVLLIRDFVSTFGESNVRLRLFRDTDNGTMIEASTLDRAFRIAIDIEDFKKERSVSSLQFIRACISVMEGHKDLKHGEQSGNALSLKITKEGLSIIGMFRKVSIPFRRKKKSDFTGVIGQLKAIVGPDFFDTAEIVSKACSKLLSKSSYLTEMLLIGFRKKIISFVGTNGHILRRSHIHLLESQVKENFDCLCPNDFWKLLTRVCSVIGQYETSVYIESSKEIPKQIFFTAKGFTLMFKLGVGDFPDWKSHWPKVDFSRYFDIQNQERFYKELQYVFENLAKEELDCGDSSIDFSVDPDTSKISIVGRDIEDIHATIQTEISSNGLEVNETFHPEVIVKAFSIPNEIIGIREGTTTAKLYPTVGDDPTFIIRSGDFETLIIALGKKKKPSDFEEKKE